MKKMTAAMAALGVVAGLGAAALPLASYASEATVPVTAIIDDAISITLTDASTADALGADGVLIEGVTPAGAVETRTIAVTVNGNSSDKYKLSLEDRLTDTALISTTNPADRIAATSEITLGGSSAPSAWGYVASTSNPTTAPTTGWKAVPARGTTPAQLLTGAGNVGTLPSTGKATTYVTFGVYADENQAPGRYTTDVIFTASVQN